MTKSTDEILASLLLPQGSDWRISLISTDEMEESIHVELEYVKPDVTVAGRHFPILDFCPARHGGIWICGNTRRTSQHAYRGTVWMDTW